MNPIEPPKVVPTASEPANRRSSLSGLHRFAENKFAVLALLFFVTAVLGIPLLWISSKFTNRERWFWAIVITLYTAVLVWIVVKLWLTVIEQFRLLYS